MFRRLGVFVGGFTLELAQDVAADEQIDRWAVLDLLGHLVDKSLVVADGDEVPRYRLLETMRAFALEKLAACRRDANAVAASRRSDARRFSCRSTRSDGQQGRRQIRVGAELDNLRAALGWAESAAGDRAFACALIG